MVLEAAGLGIEDLGAITRMSYEKLVKLINATETRYFAYRGVVGEERQVEALSIQLAALKEALEFFGPGKPTRQQQSTAKVEVMISIPEWGRTVDVTPQKD